MIKTRLKGLKTFQICLFNNTSDANTSEATTSVELYFQDIICIKSCNISTVFQWYQ